jgi:penicillin-binding protein 1A
LITLAAALLFGAVTVAIAPRIWGVANGWSGDPIALPAFEALAQPSVALAADGSVIAAFERENSQPITLAEVPETVIDSFLAVEDREFFRHNGINARSLFRATVSNVASDAAQQGASTITMQVAKNEFLGGMDRDLRYKVLQIHYALMLERQYTKQEILERYLNTVFFGNQSYGIEAAAETYFGKHARDLQPIEAAFLAGLVQSPSSFDPIDHPGRARNRFEQVVGQLVEQGNLTQAEADAHLNPDTGFQMPATVQSFADTPTPPRGYFSDALTDYLLNRTEILGTTYQQRFAALYRGGLVIQTTLNPTYQSLAENAAQVLPENSQGFEAAILSLDTRTGAVVAMVGGRNYAESQVNMTVRTRQTGSSVKFFILAAAMQAGVQDTDVINGTRPCTLPNPGDPSDPFEITDAVSRGVDTIRAQTAYSINCAYGRLAQIVGLNRVVDSMYRMAESPWLHAGGNPCASCTASERTPIQPFPALATGANEMSPLDMASGAQTIANNGLHMQPYLVESIVKEATGEVVYQHNDPGVQVLDQGTALRTTDVLKDVLEYGTGRRFPLSVPAAGKTGTQENNTNAWFVGFTPNLTTAVWVGDPDNYTPMVNVPEFNQERVQGGLYPTEIWQAYMEPASQFEGAEDWAAPPGNTRPPNRLYLPGEECPYVITGYSPVAAAPAATVAPDPNVPVDPNAPVTTAAPPAMRPNFGPVDGGTTIPPDNLNPLSPVPAFPVANGYEYRQC